MMFLCKNKMGDLVDIPGCIDQTQFLYYPVILIGHHKDLYEPTSVYT